MKIFSASSAIPMSAWGRNPVCDDSPPVDCTICHETEGNAFEASIHGQEFAEGNVDAPTCISCHGGHSVLTSKDRDSQTYPTNVPSLCGDCHRDGEAAAKARAEAGLENHVVENYTMSIHGKGLAESGLLVTATCADCHLPQ